MEKINIPNPCSENWDLMSPDEKGRFCSVCCKCVIDFTQMKREEIKQIIEEKYEERICGRFYNHQLDQPGRKDWLKDKFFNYIPLNFQQNKILLSVFSMLLFLAGCSKQKPYYGRTSGIVVSDNKTDMIQNKHSVIGEAKIPKEQDVSVRNRPDSISTKKQNR